jgi:hypothetical protein
VLLPGDPPLREIVGALTPKGLDLLEVSIGDVVQSLTESRAASFNVA